MRAEAVKKVNDIEAQTLLLENERSLRREITRLREELQREKEEADVKSQVASHLAQEAKLSSESLEAFKTRVAEQRDQIKELEAR